MAPCRTQQWQHACTAHTRLLAQLYVHAHAMRMHMCVHAHALVRLTVSARCRMQPSTCLPAGGPGAPARHPASPCGRPPPAPAAACP